MIHLESCLDTLKRDVKYNYVLTSPPDYAELGIPAHTFSTSPMDKDLDYHKVTDEVNTLNIFTISETIKAIAIGIKSIADGTDTPSRVIMTKD